MKKFSQWTFTGILILLLTACGIEYTITTRIFVDGSCLRTMTARLDSAEYKGNPFFINIDSTWEETTRMETDTAENKTYIFVTVQKKFHSVEAMNNEFYKKDLVSEEPNLRMTFSKKFRWFYTKFRYEETYVQQFPFKHFPLSDYYTREEIEVYIFEDHIADSVYYAGIDSLERSKIEKELELKGDSFIAENIFEEFYQELLKVSEKSADNFFSEINLAEIKSDIRAQTRPSLLFIEEKSADTSAYQILSRLDNQYKITAFTDLLLTDTLAFKTFDKKLTIDYLANYINNYDHNVSLPGTLINTNAHQIIDGNPNWNFGPQHYVFTDYTMLSESKKTNKWAFVFTIVIIILSLTMTLGRRRKK